jgi:asparagine synthase (glutamine-hydrolysing)
MCGIAGALALTGGEAVAPATLRRMLTLLQHRGPEVAGVFRAGPVALGHARLSIIDLTGG